jgi:hypothetical protein
MADDQPVRDGQASRHRDESVTPVTESPVTPSPREWKRSSRPSRATPSNPTPWRDPDPKRDRLPGESRKAMQKRLGRKGGRPRNPDLEKRFVPTREQREIVQLLAGYAIPHERIVKAIRNPETRRPIGVHTLIEHFEHELEAGRAEVDQMLAHGLSKRLRESNLTALIWCSKNLWNWSDRLETQRTGTTDLNIRIDPAELAEKLRQRGLPGSVFGVDVPVMNEPILISNGHDDRIDE